MITKEHEVDPKIRGSMLDCKELALELNVGPSTVRVWVSKRRVPFVQWGPRVFFMREHLPFIKMRMFLS